MELGHPIPHVGRDPSALSVIERAIEVSGGEASGSVYQVTLRIYRWRDSADAPAQPLVVYFHGGAFVGGDLDSADAIGRSLSGTAVIVSATYPLAPAAPFPAAPEAAYGALVWAAQQARKIGADAKRVFVAGDEAGGNLAAVVAMMARDRKRPQVAGQILITPMLDPCMTCDSMRHADTAGYEEAYRSYVQRCTDRLHPYAAPLQSLRLAGLPRALVVTAALDPLRDEAERYAAALITAGVPTQALRFDNAAHGLTRPDHPNFAALTEAAARFITTIDLSSQQRNAK